VYIRECSLVSQLSVLMFAGGCIEVDVSKDPPLISIDDLIHYKTTQLEVALSLKALRSELNQLLSDEIKEPYKNLMSSPKGNAVIACVAQLLSDSTIPGVCNFFAYIELMGMMGTEDEEQQPQLSI
ncbi:ATP dependent RNA helicase, partial [Biomphalaria glabrata]